MESQTIPLVHGTRNGYNKGCRLECCTEAEREYARNRRAKKKDGTWDFYIPKGRSRSQRERITKRRDYWFSLNGPCNYCGSNNKLELDHIDPSTKDKSLVRHCDLVWTWPEEKRRSELLKCQPLCYACHKKKTTEENKKPINHGTVSGYARGCRLDCCKNVNSTSGKLKRDLNKHPSKLLGRKIKPLVHGTASGYWKGCRDETCTEAYKIYNREHYLKNKKF